MSLAAFARSPDLKRLRDDGYAARLLISPAGAGHLLVADVPYVTPDRQTARGTIAVAVGIVDDVAEPAGDHTVLFIGQAPSNRDGQPLTQVINTEGSFPLADGIEATFRFSNKLPDDKAFADLYEKVTHYIGLLEPHAQSIDDTLTARTFQTVEDVEAESPFMYLDSATSRAGLTRFAEMLTLPRVAIVGLGGTGSYVLDLVAKTPIGEIHLFDGDDVLSHNAFRAPGAATLDELRARPKKVDYHRDRYSAMKRGIVAHPFDIDAHNTDELTSMNFVFLCSEGGTAKRAMVERLEVAGLPFVDVGMGIVAGEHGLLGSLQVTTSTPAQRDHLRDRVQLADADEDAIYNANIQLAELNALNATLAVIKWKKLMGFYRDEDHEHYCAYRIDTNEIINDVAMTA